MFPMPNHERKQNGEPAPSLAKPIRDVVHRSANILAAGILLTIADREHGFGIFGSHTDERCHPHPKDCTRSSEDDCGRDTGNVAGANAGGKLCH
jgi:hypothetical protein